jgi:hypothetical protein
MPRTMQIPAHVSSKISQIFKTFLSRCKQTNNASISLPVPAPNAQIDAQILGRDKGANRAASVPIVPTPERGPRSRPPQPHSRRGREARDSR